MQIGASQPIVARKTHSAAQFVYVVDRACVCLQVYPAQVADPTPIRTVGLGGVGGVVTDRAGNVYVAELDASVVEEFSSGAVTKLATISNRVHEPVGIAIDSQDRLYVTSSATASTGAAVLEFARGSHRPMKSVALVKNFAGFGIALDAHDRLFVDEWSGPGSYIQEYVGGNWTGKTYLEAADPTGIAFDAAGDLVVGQVDTLIAYSDREIVSRHYYGSGEVIRLLTRGSDGLLYVPFDAGSQSSVLAAANTPSSYRITRGLTAPFAATSGL